MLDQIKADLPACCQEMGRDKLHWILKFREKMTAVGNSVLNAGLLTETEAFYNCDVGEVGSIEDLPGGSMEGYMEETCRQLGLNPTKSLGLMTAAKMQNTAWETARFRQLELTAIVTGGVDINGGRVGEPAGYYEENGKFFSPGTINIFLVINAHLSHTALMKCLITATEAKAAALQELMTPSAFSNGLATGSGTDGILAAMNPTSSLYLTDAGMHSKLGELIGQIVKKTVKRALELETGLNPERQQNVLERLKRFGVTPQSCWQSLQKKGLVVNNRRSVSETTFYDLLNNLAALPELVTLAAGLIHLQDEVEWGLLPSDEALSLANLWIKVTLQNGIGGLGGQLSVQTAPDAPIPELLVDTLNSLVLASAYLYCST
ncbi:MAG: adenosylcobinamide amidohydrolase [Clostridia bacterium]|nr:adenosylcobinamide amidohydrolase [Clostridia bacterium]